MRGHLPARRRHDDLDVVEGRFAAQRFAAALERRIDDAAALLDAVENDRHGSAKAVPAMRANRDRALKPRALDGRAAFARYLAAMSALIDSAGG